MDDVNVCKTIILVVTNILRNTYKCKANKKITEFSEKYHARSFHVEMLNLKILQRKTCTTCIFIF